MRVIGAEVFTGLGSGKCLGATPTILWLKRKVVYLLLCVPSGVIYVEAFI